MNYKANTMPTHRQNSFLAHLRTQAYPIHCLDVLRGTPAEVIAPFGGEGFLAGALQPRSDAHLLGHQPPANGNTVEPLTLYFRHAPEGYYLYVRSLGPYFGRGISADENGHIGAFMIKEREPIPFKLIHSQRGETSLEHIKHDRVGMFLQRAGKGFVHRSSRHDAEPTYLNTAGGSPLGFILDIQERNAPWLSYPDEF